MSQQQPRRVPEEELQGKPIKYGDVFPVQGELAEKPIAPQDAALMQTAESMILGQTQKGGTAAAMQAAATYNERAGLVGHGDISAAAGDEGVTVTEMDVPGGRIITEKVAGQVLGQYVQPVPVQNPEAAAVMDQSAITIGEALEAAVTTAGDKPIDQSDAAAIQAAEVRATGSNLLAPGGLASAAQSAATFNASVDVEDQKVKLGHLLTDATWKLPADKVVTRQDAEGVMGAELRNSPDLATHPGGVSAAIAAAARLNEAQVQEQAGGGHK
uniref:SMP domain-containing protein n=1 Tax=Kalanchoe fedtschenkoi TaxID=63787 RepID=A0A7N0ZTW2_KALFE